LYTLAGEGSIWRVGQAGLRDRERRAGTINQRWTLTFDEEKLNVRAMIGDRPEISIDSETGG
jgi:hypothetical protein